MFRAGPAPDEGGDFSDAVGEASSDSDSSEASEASEPATASSPERSAPQGAEPHIVEEGAAEGLDEGGQFTVPFRESMATVSKTVGKRLPGSRVNNAWTHCS